MSSRARGREEPASLSPHFQALLNDPNRTTTWGYWREVRAVAAPARALERHRVSLAGDAPSKHSSSPRLASGSWLRIKKKPSQPPRSPRCGARRPRVGRFGVTSVLSRRAKGKDPAIEQVGSETRHGAVASREIN